MSAWRQRWRSLAPREQRALALGVVALALILGYLLLWDPLAQSRETWRIRAAAAQADLAWMRTVAPQVQAARASQPALAAADGRSLLARVDASARDAGLGAVLLRVEPVSAGQVRVQFQRAGFDALMRWLETLAAQYGTRVTELSATRSDGVGLVDARLSLEESPSP